MALAYPNVVTFRDAKGNTARVKYNVTGANPTALSTAAQAIFTPLVALSTLAVQTSRGAFTTHLTANTYPSPVAQYPNVEDKAVFTFGTVVGSLHRIKVPGPLASIFLADLETIDPANAAVTAFTTAFTSNALDSDGNGIVFFIGGTRTRVKARKRLNIFVLTPSLTVSEPAE